jgi:DNA polymerase elongation subunit (family B)
LKNQGWIIDLYPKDCDMIVWLKSLDGRCIKVVDRWQPVIYVSGELNALLDLACQPFIPKCSLTYKFTRPGDAARSTVLETEVKNETHAITLAQRIQQYGNFKFRLYNVDIPFTQMYLYQKNLFPLAFVQVENTNSNVQWTLKDSREALDYKLPPLHTIRLQVRTAKVNRIQTFNDRLGSLKIIRSDGESFEIDSGSECEKLFSLVEAFREMDPDIVLTEDGDSFIFPYLARRALHNSIEHDLILDREGAPLRIYETQGHSYFSYGKILYRQKAARLLGRLHIDEANAFFVNDCGLEGLFEVARTCIIPIQRASRTTIGTSMTSLQLYHAVKEDVLIPWSKNSPEEFKDGNELMTADRGGFIFEPKVGIHDTIGELDFSSLYPTIMFKKNLSGETVNCTCCSNSPYKVPELTFNICERWQGIVPRSLDILLRKRAAYKKFKNEAMDPPTRLKYNQRQAALKWILVCS